MNEALKFRRANVLTEPMPEAEFARVLGASLTLSITADGQSYMVKLSRRNLMALLESGFEALKELEPGWR